MYCGIVCIDEILVMLVYGNPPKNNDAWDIYTCRKSALTSHRYSYILDRLRCYVVTFVALSTICVLRNIFLSF